MAEHITDVDGGPETVEVNKAWLDTCDTLAGNLHVFAQKFNPGWPDQCIVDNLSAELDVNLYFKWLEEQHVIASRSEQLGLCLDHSLSVADVRRLLLTYNKEDPKLDLFAWLRSQLGVDSTSDTGPETSNDQQAKDQNAEILRLRDENQKLKDELNEKQQTVDQLRAKLSASSTGKTKGIQNGVDVPPTRPQLLESEPFLTVHEWPGNLDPHPGPNPTRYDLWYGRHKTVDRLPAWTPQVDEGPPRVPNNKFIITHKGKWKRPTTEPLAGCGGNVCWDDPSTAYKSTKMKAAKVGWFQHDGFAIRRWATPSRTRSTTLPVGMKLPHDAEFSPKHIKLKRGSGGAWSCCSRSARHNGKIAIIPFSMSTCPLCKASRHRGQSIYHDFRLTGERGERVDVQDWPEQWKEKKTLKDKEDVDAEVSETPVEKARKRSRTDAFEADVDADNIDNDTEAGPSPIAKWSDKIGNDIEADGFDVGAPVTWGDIIDLEADEFDDRTEFRYSDFFPSKDIETVRRVPDNSDGANKDI